MASLNRVQLIGNLGGEVEHRLTATGKSVANFTLATTDSFAREGVTERRTEWHRIVVWESLADTCAKYLQKGSGVFLEGRIEQREYTDKEGVARVSYDIVARDVQFLSRTKGKGDEAKVDPAAATPAEA